VAIGLGSTGAIDFVLEIRRFGVWASKKAVTQSRES
jgi:hypothetical protein